MKNCNYLSMSIVGITKRTSKPIDPKTFACTKRVTETSFPNITYVTSMYEKKREKDFAIIQ